MSGGAHEYVAACFKGYTNMLLTEEKDVAYISKYIDVYDEYSSSKYGDAVFETSSSSSEATSWFSDYSYIVYSDGPVFIRGGSYDNGFNAGLFNFNNYYTGSKNGVSFRPVCIVK